MKYCILITLQHASKMIKECFVANMAGLRPWLIHSQFSVTSKRTIRIRLNQNQKFPNDRGPHSLRIRLNIHPMIQRYYGFTISNARVCAPTLILNCYCEIINHGRNKRFAILFFQLMALSILIILISLRNSRNIGKNIDNVVLYISISP